MSPSTTKAPSASMEQRSETLAAGQLGASMRSGCRQGPTLGINGWDTGMVITAAIAHLEISDGSQWVTDDSWRHDPAPESVGKQGWCNTAFDASGWDMVKDIGPIGTSPLGHAPHLYSHKAVQPIGFGTTSLSISLQYLRKEFTLPKDQCRVRRINHRSSGRYNFPQVELIQQMSH